MPCGPGRRPDTRRRFGVCVPDSVKDCDYLVTPRPPVDPSSAIPDQTTEGCEMRRPFCSVDFPSPPPLVPSPTTPNPRRPIPQSRHQSPRLRSSSPFDSTLLSRGGLDKRVSYTQHFTRHVIPNLIYKTNLFFFCFEETFSNFHCPNPV